MSMNEINFQSRQESIEFFRAFGMSGTVKALEEAEHQDIYKLLCLYSAWFEDGYHLYIKDRLILTFNQFLEVLCEH